MGDKKATVLLTDNHALILQGLQSVITLNSATLL